MSITTYSALDALLVNNTSHAIRGNDLNDWLDSSFSTSPYVAKTTAYTATESDEVINVSSASGVAITLPACASTRVGKIYTVRKGSNDGARVVLMPSGADTINGLSSVQINRTGDYVTVINTGAGYLIIASEGWFRSRVFAQSADVTVANTTSETSLVGSGSGFTSMPALFYTQYAVLRVKARGIISNTGTPNIQMRFRGGSAGTTELATTNNIATASSLSNTGWTLDLTLTCRTTGASGTAAVNGYLTIGTNTYPLANTTTKTIDTTGVQAHSVSVFWGAASASNTITCQELSLNLER